MQFLPLESSGQIFYGRKFLPDFSKKFFDRTFYRIFCPDFFVQEWFRDLTGFDRIFSH